MNTRSAARLVLRLMGTLAALCLAVFFVPRFVAEPDAVWVGDWRQMHLYWEAPRQTLLRFGQAPLWNPYYCGGNLLLGHPHSQFVVPFFPLALLTSTAWGYRALVLGHLVLGMVGVERLLARHGVALLARAAGAIAFSCCGFFAWHGVGGHVWAYGFLLLPWLWMAWERARTGHVPAMFAAGAVLAWMVYHAGIYSTPFSGLLLGLDAVGRAALRPDAGRRRLTPLLAVAAVGALGVLLSAPKTLPLLDYLADHHRVFDSADDALWPRDLWQVFLGRHEGKWWDTDGGRLHYRWAGEYAADVGHLLFPLALVGVLAPSRQQRRVRWGLGLLCVAFVALMVGDHGPASPYALLRRLPVFKGLHVPTRFGVIVVFLASLLAAFAIDDVMRRLGRGGLAHLAGVGLLAALVVEPTLHNRQVNEQAERYPVAPEAELQRVPAWEQSGGGSTRMFVYAMEGHGLVECYEEAQLDRAEGLWLGPGPQARVVGEGEATLARWSPGRLDVRLSLERASTVLLNQNHHDGWRITAGDARLAPQRHMLAIEALPGTQDVTLRYLPWPFLLGLWVTLGALYAWAWSAGRAARRARQARQAQT